MELVNIPDHITDQLFAYQVPHLLAIGRSLDANPTTLDASDTGTGKTRTGCGLAAWKQYDVFIISPKPVIEDWFTVGPLFGANIIGVANYEAIKNGKYYPTLEHFQRDERVECPFIELGTDDITAETTYTWDFPRRTLIIIDEAHRGKNHCTENSAMMMSLIPAVNFPCVNKLLILSATITDKIEHFRVCARLLGIAQYDRHAWAAWLRFIKQQYPGRSIAEIINIVIFPRFGARMRIGDIKMHQDALVRDLFKNNDVQAVVEQMSPDIEADIARAYGEIDQALAALRQKQQLEVCPLTMLLRARQRIEMLKVPIFVLHAMEYLMNGYNVIIFVNFNETTEHLFVGLDAFVQEERQSHITFINGKQSAVENSRNKREFITRASCLLICNIFAGGVGLSLHGERVVTLISPTWSSIMFKQALGRAYRAGGGDVIQRIIYCRGRAAPAGDRNTNDTTFTGPNGEKIGIEELIAANVNKKLATLEWLNNGDDIDLMQI